MKHARKKRGFFSYCRLLIIAICVCVFVYSASQLISIYLEYRHIDTYYENLRKSYGNDKNDEFVIDWRNLLERNNDVIAWIQVPGTHIDYPVLKGATNDTYLRHDIDHKYLVAGSIFVDAMHSKPFEEPNTIIYGHHMKNDSMFSDLLLYQKDPKYAKEHSIINIYFPNDTVKEYKVISTHIVDGRSRIYMTNIPDLHEYYNLMDQDNVLDAPIEQNNAPVITLSTCLTYDLQAYSRVAVHASLQNTKSIK